ncbi:hypothetical protein M3Y98_01036300 [Aphelenchoides besseyi]|nr:hypothetical protein M3Y98_01036300 [Aphelenchoides besseyi]KAI6209922.1 hypothetical protein M3Y96_00272400 [Aphelenchoides besseyi]
MTDTHVRQPVDRENDDSILDPDVVVDMDDEMHEVRAQGQPQENEEEIYEEITGEIMQGEHGTFFVATDAATDDIDLDTVNKIEVVVNADGTETVIFESGTGTIDDTQMIEDEKAQLQYSPNQMELGAVTTAENGDDEGMYLHAQHEEIKGRRNRVYGHAECPECRQSFVNTARLERHLSVHQSYGSFLCQLCGKTYKYEYNLFYHWRKTCRDLSDLIDEEERKKIEVNALREIVEDIASKKQGLNSMELGISNQPLFRTLGLDPIDESRKSMYGKRGVLCKACGVTVLAAHLPKHLNVHRGLDKADDPSVGGGYFCDLCGLIFRQYDNLYKHWRTNCPKIQANLPDDDDLSMDNEGLRHMVEDLLKKSTIEMGDTMDIMPSTSHKGLRGTFSSDAEKARALDSLTADLNIDLSGLPAEENDENDDTLMQENNLFDQKWIEEHGIVFADDMPESAQRLGSSSGMVRGLGQKWANTGEMVQCPECFKTFMNISRLEKHMAGYHASSGTHHCALCGNRFKYDYNLLYHYRRSCPYTKAYIDRDVREQIESSQLRKLVRNLAQRQPALPSSFVSGLNSVLQNDALVHKQMLQGDGENKMPITRIPPHNVQPPRPGLPHGYRCPHCNIIFYGTTAIKLHMQMRHHEEFQPKDDDEIIDEELITEMPHDTLAGTDTVNLEDVPPTLEMEERKPVRRHVIMDEQGNDITNLPEVQELIASGEIQFNEGEQIILVSEAPAEGQQVVEKNEDLTSIINVHQVDPAIEEEEIEEQSYSGLRRSQRNAAKKRART